MFPFLLLTEIFFLLQSPFRNGWPRSQMANINGLRFSFQAESPSCCKYQYLCHTPFNSLLSAFRQASSANAGPFKGSDLEGEAIAFQGQDIHIAPGPPPAPRTLLSFRHSGSKFSAFLTSGPSSPVIHNLEAECFFCLSLCPDISSISSGGRTRPFNILPLSRVAPHFVSGSPP